MALLLEELLFHLPVHERARYLTLPEPNRRELAGWIRESERLPRSSADLLCAPGTVSGPAPAGSAVADSGGLFRTMGASYTVALTSCGRFDLLERTLASLLPRLEGPVAKILIIEDSGDRGVVDIVRQFDGPLGRIETIVNDPPVGQTKSIDRLYSHIETEWVFHCEDDWEFFADGFISRSFALLEEFDRLSMVSPRDTYSFPSEYFHPEKMSSSGVRYCVANPTRAGPYSGLFFSPGLRRMSDYRIVGPYDQVSVTPTEDKVGRVYLGLGYRVAALVEPAVRHIGNGRHVKNLTKARGWLNKKVRSMKERQERRRWERQPHTDPVEKARRRQISN